MNNGGDVTNEELKAQARREALEEAAKACEATVGWYQVHSAFACAKAIRALAEQDAPQPEAKAQPQSGLSWGGFNVYGDPKSITAVQQALHEAGTVPQLREEIRRARAAQPPPTHLVEDLSKLVVRLCRKLRKTDPLGDHKSLTDGAMDFLRRKGLQGSPLRDEQPQPPKREHDTDLALDLLAELFDAYENGVQCYEDPEDQSGYLGHAFRLDDKTFKACADLLNKHRPVVRGITQQGADKDDHA